MFRAYQPITQQPVMLYAIRKVITSHSLSLHLDSFHLCCAMLGLSARHHLQRSTDLNAIANHNFARLLPIVQAARFSQPLLYNAHALLQSLRQSLAWYVLQSSLSALPFEDLNSARVAASLMLNLFGVSDSVCKFKH